MSFPQPVSGASSSSKAQAGGRFAALRRYFSGGSFSRLLDGLVTFAHSVRLRMALWFALVLAAVMVVFSLFVYYRTAQDLRDQTAGYMVSRIREMNAALLRSYWAERSDGTWGLVNPGARSPFELHENEVIVLCDTDGRMVSAWGEIDDTLAGQVAWDVGELDPLKASKRFLLYSLTTESGRSVDYLFNPTPIVSENRLLGWVILGRPLDPNGQLPRLILTLVLAGLGTLLVALLGAFWLADRALWPVKAITRTAREISETDLSRRLNLRSRDELGELAGTFDRMLDRLQAAFNRQRQFTADASHELRTPLTIIGLETGRALSTARSTEDYRHALQVIQSENEFMTRLVTELLTLARMDSGQLQIKHEPLDLSDVTLDVVERYAQIAAQKGIRLETGGLPELPVLGDRQFLAQMVSNLLDNAIKYSPAGNGHYVRAETGSVEESGRRCAWVRVTDNGAGIPTEHLPHLFDRFYRVDKARSHNLEEEAAGPAVILPEEGGDEAGEKISGSGLGLAIVQWIAQVHGGSVTVTSQPGEGSVFEVRLPLGVSVI